MLYRACQLAREAADKPSCKAYVRTHQPKLMCVPSKQHSGTSPVLQKSDCISEVSKADNAPHVKSDRASTDNPLNILNRVHA